MKKYLIGIFAITIAVGLNAFSIPQKINKGVDPSFTYFNVTNASLTNPPTAGELNNLTYTGENPAVVCKSGSVPCKAVYTAPSTPTIGDHPLSTTRFVSIDPANSHYK